MGNPGKDAGFCLAVRATAQVDRLLFAAVWLAVAGCAIGPSALSLPQDFVDNPSPSAAAHQSQTGAASEGPGKANEEPAEAPSKPEPYKPRTLPQAVCDYLQRLRFPQSPAENATMNGTESSNGQKKEAASEKDTKGNQKGEKSQPAGGAQKPDTDAPKTNNKQESESKEKKEKDEKEKPEEDNKEKGKKEEPQPAWYSAHAQATMDTQAHSNFSPPYTGPHSLLPNEPAATSVTATLFLDARLWECGCYTGELVFNPELAGGSGFSGVNGIAGFTNGDITRVGVVEPTPYFARLYVRQTWGLGGEQEPVEDEANQIAGKRDVERITLSVGKFAFTDVIDNNTYSHDPRSQMQNWSLMYNGAWDYPANVRGYTYGIAVEYNQKYWALRYGIMAEPSFANSGAIDPHFTKAFGQAVEWEQRYAICDHPGRLRLMAYLNRAHMGDYLEALTAMPVDPDVTLTRSYRFKYGFGLNFQQELTRDLGLWGRLGWSDGHTETWAFTPIDRTAALGFLLKGRRWARPNDEVGLAAAFNGIAKDHREYLAAGGLDFSIGDGRLSYGIEDILEVYYRLAIIKGIYVNADFQEIFNPAYNRDRGPVAVGALLVHIEF